MIHNTVHRIGLRSRYIRATRLMGTTLIEVLVVIVILLVGILAVVQIFPKGFLLLSLSRKSAQATALAREESERLKTRADLLPEMILPINSTLDDVSTLPNELGPDGASVAIDGTLLDSANGAVGNWAMHSGANRFRLIVGEKHPIPSPRSVGGTSDYFGGLLMPEFGPVDPSVPISVTGNELSKTYGLPDGLVQRGTSALYDTIDSHGDFEYFAVLPTPSSATLYLPTGAEERQYLVTAYALVTRNGQLEKRLFRNLPVTAAIATVGGSNTYPLLQVNLSAAISAKLGVGEALGSLELDAIRVSRAFKEVTAFSTDAFEYKRLNPALGTLLFNPRGYSMTISTSNGRAPLSASLDYAVLDWRILHDDFRLSDTRQVEHRLPLGSIKTSGTVGFDGTPQRGIPVIEPKPTNGSGLTDISDTQSVRDDHFVVVDTESGGVFCEVDPANANRPALIVIDKSVGSFRFIDADPTTVTATEGKLLLPDGTIKLVDVLNRPLRALYMANNEWSVQVLKAASQYSLSPASPGAAQFYVGGTNVALGGVTTRLYFPACDANQKVTIDEVNFIDSNGKRQQMVGQDFVIRFRTGDAVGLPAIDLTDVNPAATGFDFSLTPAKAVKGASIVVRVLWNPDSLAFSSNKVSNLRKVDEWGRGWRRSTAQTFVQRGENIR